MLRRCTARVFQRARITYSGLSTSHIRILANKMSSEARQTRTDRQNPSDFLKQITGLFVVVKLNNGSEYRGVLNCLDGYMNIVLEQTEEFINGEFKQRYGDAFIRGNNVYYISAQKIN